MSATGDSTPDHSKLSRGVAEESEPRTIWILVMSLSFGGAERTIVDLANGLAGQQFEVVVWTVFDVCPLASRLDDAVTYRTLGVEATRGDDPHEITGAVDPRMYIAAPLQFVRAVRLDRPDIVHSFLFYENIICRLAGLVSPGTVVVNGERGFHNSTRTLLHVLDRVTLPFADVVVSNSRAGAEHYLERGVEWSNLRVIPNGRRLDEYRDASGGGLRAALGVPPDALVVGTVGRLVERKGHFDLLRAWARVSDAVPDAHLVVVGYGPERDALEALADDLGVGSTVHFTGARDDVPELLGTMDLFVFPSHWEGHPGALLEAMAAGLPIVATTVPGSDELVSDRETGLMVPPRDPVSLGDAVERLCRDSQLASELGERAQAEAFERYTLAHMVDRFEILYEELTCPASPEDR
ncbi:glycosyltransferase [Salinirubellus salinus]|uniref:Glycosyltransferase n=1 Tax=Salinirubellus salinus TaxID=1364945 RepID=A0A9E7UB18_9EURY|nr:glycosyltransferase [Salinirubellus salinus]UWM54379.1 glycosyltransferase [Salinirubellus salinus]